MVSRVSIYLAGSIKKENEPLGSYWSDEEMFALKAYLFDYAISFLNPGFRTDDLSDQRSVFGRDMTQVFCSDIVFVDARERRGLGVGAEMMWAKLHKIPVITLAPKNSHYHKEQTTLLDVPVTNWIHPFIESLSDAIVDDLNAGAGWIRRFLTDPSLEIKSIATIQSAMQYYRDTQLAHDAPMKALLAANEVLNVRIANIR